MEDTFYSGRDCLTLKMMTMFLDFPSRQRSFSIAFVFPKFKIHFKSYLFRDMDDI